MRRFLEWYSARRPCRLIEEDGRPYLERYYVASPFGLRVYLHKFVGSDPDRGLHDHPWRWALSILLAGWYYEERRDTPPGLPREVRRLNWLRGDTFHRVLMPREFLASLRGADSATAEEIAAAPADCWSLFIHRVGHAKRWGFLRPVSGPEPGDEGAAVFLPFRYPGGGSRSGEWWRQCPTGAQVRASAEARRQAAIYSDRDRDTR
jgi:hypothetical protein